MKIINSFSNAGNNVEYKTAIAINQVIQNNMVTHRKVGPAGDVGNTGTSGFIDLSVNDNVSLMILNDDGVQDVGTHATNVNLMRIGS